ncbi:hypothetical protein K461DRAFT_265413 [Myriangium duriaei CBS 260.36]|uniref:Uncharacterized protein n=1 Tax=Myriangium duriaei CBS 260.36 TaxID=1168546 RepID=A0A9P4MQU9_9PEZI|nr:hypothetical protein K461DRAFT_265413 [Myriangium duriaei CBS 260.36]
MGESALHASSLLVGVAAPTEQRHLEFERRLSAPQNITRHDLSYATPCPTFKSLHDNGSGPRLAQDEVHDAGARLDMTESCSTNRRHTHALTYVQSELSLTRPQVDRPVPPIFSLPPLASIHGKPAGEQPDHVGKHGACRHCETFGNLVGELSEVTALLLHDIGHLAEDPDYPLSGLSTMSDSGNPQVHVSNFYRSLHGLRTLRHTMSSVLRRNSGPAASSNYSSPEERRDCGESLIAHPKQFNHSYPMNSETPRKRLKYDSPGPQASGAYIEGEGEWRLGEPISLAPETGKITSSRSPRTRQDHYAFSSPTSDLACRFIRSPPSVSTHDERTIPPSNPASTSQPPFMLQHEEYSGTSNPPLSSASAPSLSYSSSSAESTHYAHLQRQITLKTLSLQTLQSEYSSLLQKLHRERLRSQAIERKSSVAESEVNTLSTQNEDLAEQTKSLTTQVEECESKIGSMRADFSRDKAQWINILANDTKLMGLFSADKRGWTEEKARLQASISKLERLVATPARSASQDSTTSSHALVGASSDEIRALQSRLAESSETISTLRAALADSKQSNKTLGTHARALMEAIGVADERTTRALSQAS